MRWWLIVWMALLVMGCHRKPKDDLVLLTPGGAIRPAVEAAVAEFLKEHPGTSVKIVSTPGADYYKKSLTMLAGRTQVDLLWLGQGFGMFAGRGALLDLRPLIERDAGFSLSDYHPEVTGWYRYGEALYGIPYGINVMVLAYNLDLIEKAGMTPPKGGWTLDDMIALAEGTRDGLAHDKTYQRMIGLGFADLDYRYYGLSLLTPDDRRFALNNERGRQWLERNLELIYRKRLLRRESDFASLDGLTNFINQQAIIAPVQSAMLTHLSGQARFRWDVIVPPVGVGGNRSCWASSSGFCIPAASKNPDLAWKLLKKLVGAEFQRGNFAIEIPALTSLQSEYLAFYKDRPAHIEEMIRALGMMQPNPRLTAFPEVEAEWNYWKDLILMQRIAPAEALAAAEKKINRILETHRKEGAHED